MPPPSSTTPLSHSPAGLQQITPVLLTYNEEANLSRTLSALRWAKRVVVVDSGSTDQTEPIARSFPNVDWFVHPFANHSNQWSFGIFETNVDTSYVLALDADMIVPQALLDEATRYVLPNNYPGALLPFTLLINGTPLLGSLYPPQVRLFRKDSVTVTQSGHTQVFTVPTPLYEARSRILHDDRKGFDHWLQAQIKYSLLESERITSGTSFALKDRLRLTGIMPVLTLVVSYLKAGAFFRGFPSASYALERCLFEMILLGRLLRHRFTK